VAEGSALLKRHTVSSCIEGSNPSLSAIKTSIALMGVALNWRSPCSALTSALGSVASHPGHSAIAIPDMEAAIRACASIVEKNCKTMSTSEAPFVVPMPGRRDRLKQGDRRCV
jgi:hypothetical protein